MQDIRKNVSTDSRAPLERMRRTHLFKLADAWGIQYPKGAPAETMRAILRGQGVDPFQEPPNGKGIEWEEVVTQDDSGNRSVQRYPKGELHASARANIDAEAILRARVEALARADKAEQEKKQADDRVTALEKQVAELVAALKDSLTQKEPKDMTMPQLRSLAKAEGITAQRTTTKAEILEMLDGKDATERGE